MPKTRSRATLLMAAFPCVLLVAAAAGCGLPVAFEPFQALAPATSTTEEPLLVPGEPADVRALILDEFRIDWFADSATTLWSAGAIAALFGVENEESGTSDLLLAPGFFECYTSPAFVGRAGAMPLRARLRLHCSRETAGRTRVAVSVVDASVRSGEELGVHGLSPIPRYVDVSDAPFARRGVEAWLRRRFGGPDRPVLLSPPAIDALRRRLDDEEADVRAGTLLTIGFLRVRELRPEVIARIPASREACQAAGELGDPRAVPDLMHEAEQTKSHERRLASIAALGRIVRPAAAAVPLLLRIAASDDLNAPELSLRALRLIAPDDPRVHDAFRESIDARDLRIRTEAAKGLALTGADPDLGMRVLRELLDSRSESVRARAVRALGEVGPEAADREELRRLLRDPDAGVRVAAAAALARLRTPG